jgi:HEAT repeat protein
VKRKTSSFLILGALAGVVATVFLLTQMLGSSTSRTRSDASGHGVSQERTDRARPKYDGVVRVEPPRGTRIGRGGVRPSGAFPPGASREPYNGPLTEAEIVADSNEVLRLIRGIPGEDDRQKRQQMYRELQKLIRGLGPNLPHGHKQELLEMLVTIDPQWRRLVGETLGYLHGDKETARQLLDLLKSRPERTETRRAILYALGNMKVKEVVPELLKSVRSGYADEASIIDAIGRIGGEGANDGLLELLGETLQTRTRKTIERVLGSNRNPVVLEKLEKDLALQKDLQTRLSYVKILGESRDPQYAGSVRQLLGEDQDPQVRKAAIRALGRFGDPVSGELLLSLVQDGNTQDRVDATNAIYSIKNSDTVNQLATKWNELGPDAQRAVMMAGRRITQPSDELMDLAKRNLAAENLRMRTYSAQLLGRRGRDDAVEPLVHFLRGAQHTSEQSAALRALMGIRTKKAAEEGLASLHVIPNASRRQQYEKEFKRILEREEARPR